MRDERGPDGRLSYWKRLTRLVRRDPVREADDELGFHFEMRVRDYMRRGMSEIEARAAARSRIGDMERVRKELGRLNAEESRAERRREWLADLAQDVRYGLRMLGRAPTFTAMSVTTLALGIGATTAIFSLVWAVLLAPLPYPQPERLVRIWETSPRGADRNVVSAGNVFDWHERARSFTGLGAHSGPYAVTLTGDADASMVTVADMQPELFDVLGVAPLLGRPLTRQDAVDGGAAVLGHALWQTRYGSDSTVVGTRVVLNDESLTVVGVMPAGFDFPTTDVDFWVPLTDRRMDPSNRTSHNFQVLARLRDDATVETAQTEMAAIAAGIADEHPAEMTGWGARVVPFHADITREVRALFWVLLGGVAVVLLITCANVANLLLARAVDRQREMALRGALGAGSGRLVRQLLTESAILAVLGGVGAVVLAPMLLAVLTAAAPADVPLVDRAVINARMLAFAAATALSSALLFGLAPAARLARVDLERALRSGRDAAQGGHVRLRGSLLACQVALSVVLLVGAGLFVRSFRALGSVDLGFEPAGLALMDVDLPPARYPGTSEQVSFYDRLLEHVGAIPGAAAVAGSSQPPGATDQMTFSFKIEGRTAPNPSGREDDEVTHAVTPGYFETVGLRMASGRSFEPGDDADGVPVVILNESLARKHFPEGDAVGQRITFREGETPWREIVGVVEDARLASPDAEPRAGIFIPYAQKSWPWATWMTVVVRSRAGLEASALAAPLRAALREVDPDLPPLRIYTVRQSFAENTARRSFAMTLVSGFGLLALVLSVVGLYGLITYSVSREQREIGVRIALGAHARDVVGRVLRRSVAVTAAGTVAGLVAAVAVSRWIAGLLFGVSPVDAVTYGLCAALMVVVASLTATVPALKAARTDPVEAIRSD